MDIITRINWVDVLVVIILLRIGYIAFQEGLSHVIFPLFGSMVTAIISLRFYSQFALSISRSTHISSDVLGFIIFIIIAVAVDFLVRFLRSVLDKVISVQWHPLIEKFGGVALGLMRGSVMASIILMIIALVPIPYLQYSIRDRSLVGMSFLRIGPSIYAKTAELLSAAGVKGQAVYAEYMVRDLVADKSMGKTTAPAKVNTKVKRPKKAKKQVVETIEDVDGVDIPSGP